MNRTIEERECDHCHRKVQGSSSVMFGGSPFHGWLHVERTNGGTTIEALHQNGCWDFCSGGCLFEFFRSRMCGTQEKTGITFEGREDEMLVFHRNGKHYVTLYAPSPSEASQLEKFLEKCIET